MGGMVFASMAFVTSSLLQQRIDTQPVGSVLVLWQLPQIFLITLAEVLVSVISLDFFYAEAPADAKAAVSALALLTTSIGDILCGLLYQILAPHFKTSSMLLIFAGMM